MRYPQGAVEFAEDPFKDGDAGRPWVIANTDAMPFHREQPIALTLTTKTWYDDRMPIDPDMVIEGSLPRESSILPWAVASIDAEAISTTLAQLDNQVVDRAIEQLGTYLGIE